MFQCKVGQNVVLYHSLRFLDGFQFMSQSLDSSAKTVDEIDFKLLRAGFPNIEKIFERLNKKDFFPYNYLDSFEKCNEPVPTHGFSWNNNNTSTKMIEITEEQQNFALGFYYVFICKKLGDYHDIYLRTDVFLLGDIFQKIGEVRKQRYKLDPGTFTQRPT